MPAISILNHSDMIIHRAEFLVSNSNYKQCPSQSMPEFAFIGRSNVGKSSLINALVNRKDLAKTSSTPGKTQLINHFLINNAWLLVDLPGYGYARSSQKNRAAWGNMVKHYVLHRTQLSLIFVLIDSRIPPQAIDIDFINFLGTHNVPLALAYTKTDKQNQATTAKNIAAVQQELQKTWEELPRQFITASPTKRGCEAILQYIDEVIALLNASV